MHTGPGTYWAALVRVTSWMPWSHTRRRCWVQTWSLATPPTSAASWTRPGAHRRSSASNPLAPCGRRRPAVPVADAGRDATMMTMGELRSGVGVPAGPGGERTRDDGGGVRGVAFSVAGGFGELAGQLGPPGEHRLVAARHLDDLAPAQPG